MVQVLPKDDHHRKEGVHGKVDQQKSEENVVEKGVAGKNYTKDGHIGAEQPAKNWNLHFFPAVCHHRVLPADQGGIPPYGQVKVSQANKTVSADKDDNKGNSVDKDENGKGVH